jgi:hypothetical protein
MATTLERARKIAAAVCEAAGNSDAYCEYMREGSYDDQIELRIAHAALLTRLPEPVANDPIKGALTGDEFREYLNEFAPSAEQVSA